MSVLVVREERRIERSLRKILAEFDLKNNLSKGVFLKPNIVFPVSEKSGEITRKKVVKAIVYELRRLDPNVAIIMGEGTAAGTEPKENFNISKYSKLAQELEIPLLDLNEVEHQEVRWEYGTLHLPKIVFERYYINLPILKASSAALISGAMKNQKGLIFPTEKKDFHRLGLHKPLAYLNRLIQPDLTIMDGVNFFKRNILIAGTNTYEVDSLAIRLLGIPEPDYMKMARGIGVGNDEFVTRGVESETFQCRSLPPTSEYKQYLRLRVWSNPKACSMCRYAFLRISKTPWEDIRYSLKMYLRLMRYAVTGADILIGSDPKLKTISPKVICVGNCTKEIACDNGYEYVPGCPPQKEQMLKYFCRQGLKQNTENHTAENEN